MALEITGLALGAAALVGTLKDCIDVYSTIVAARSLTDDAEVLNTKLDVERMLLLQWADRAGLTEPEKYDKRLEDADLNQTVARVLESIKRLLSDGKLLKERYGLVDHQEVRQDIVLGAGLEAKASSARLKHFTERLKRLSLHIEVPQREQSIGNRFKWVVRDREKFASLMNDLSYFVSRLHALLPAQGQSARTMTEEDLAQIRSIPSLRLIVEASTGFQPQIALIAEQAIECLNQRRVLDRLWYQCIDDRKTNIKDRHFRTFEWALDPLRSTLKWDNLAEWLRDGSGLYWLAGKAGSGKSTLMKYLSDHPETITLLKEWAGGSELVTLQFFFYALGRSEQKSQEGVLRSLVFQFLNKHPELIQSVLPAMWREAVINEDKDYDLGMPSIAEMQISLLQLAGEVLTNAKFCILIDGLDEFEEKHATILAFLSRLERMPNVKILVSSRPLPAFVSAFEHAPKMYLQDLTNRDIEAYIDDAVLHHPHIAHLTHVEPKMPMKIARILIEKASGVFLWVALACQSILVGLDEYDTVSELINRATGLPPELDDFFRQTIAAVNPRKREQCARILRLVFESQTSSAFYPIPPMGLAIVEEQGLRADFMGRNAAFLSHRDMVQRCQRLEGRLRSRCSGLVEIQRHTFAPFKELFANRDLMFPARALTESIVAFMHRSLYEFLCTEAMWEWDVLRVDNDCGGFEPHVILASLWTQLAAQSRATGWVGVGFVDISSKAMCFANAIAHNLRAAATAGSPRMLATNFSRLQSLFTGDGPYELWECPELWLPHQPRCREGYKDLSLGLALAAERGIASLVQLALEDPDDLRRMLIPPEAGHVQDCDSFSTCPTELYKLNRARAGTKYANRSTVFPLLYHAICRPFLALLRNANMKISRASKASIAATEAVSYLLEKGHDPNEGFFTDEDGLMTTPWVEWLDFIRPGGWGFVNNDGSSLEDSEYGVELVHQRAAFTLLFVDAGADIGAPGTGMCDMVDDSLSRFILNAAQRGGRTHVELARSDDMWLKVRDTLVSLRSVESRQDAHS